MIIPADPPLRIGIFSPYSLTVPGGVQAQVLGLARELRRLGHESRVLGPCDGPPPESFVTPLGNSLPLAANGSIAPLAPDPPAALRTLHALRNEDFDVIHLHEPLVPGPVMTALVVHTAPTVATFHAAGTSASYRLLRGPLSRMINRIDRKVVVSKDALALAQGHLGGTYDLLFNGVEIEQIRSVEPAVRPNDSTRPIVFFCGRHEDRKGLHVLVEAVKGSDLDVSVWVGSDGPDTAALMASTAHDDRFEWLGRISDADKFGRLQTADVFCAPSLGGESFGVVLIEAMAAGTTVVASALDGYRNVATDDVDAMLVPPGDPDALAGALRRAVRGGADVERIRRTGLERAETFAMSRLATEYLRIYRELLVHSSS